MNRPARNRYNRSGSSTAHPRFSNTPKRSGGFRGGHRKAHKEFKMPSFDPSKFINTSPVGLAEELYTPHHTFGSFALQAKLTSTIEKLGMITPTPIQDQAIPLILQGKDIIGLAETGTGKTAAFLVPLIENTLKGKGKQTLILAPTRELALQIQKEVRALGEGLNIHSAVCVGGLPIRPQIKALRNHNHFIVGTPGRIQDMINNRHINTSTLTGVVLDEADRMLDMGFIHDIKRIFKTIPKERQTLLFSATMKEGTDMLAREFLKSPITLSVKKRDVASSIAQNVVPYDSDKFQTLLDLLNKAEFTKVLVFGSMKHSVKKLAQQLSENKVSADSLHGNKSPGQRQRALGQFKNGAVRVLVATDVAARGIHIDDISHVINYDLPQTFEDYVHRIGRTGRGSKKGKALTLVPSRASKPNHRNF